MNPSSLLVGDVLVEGLLDEGDAAAVHGLAVGQEALLQRRGHAREALQQREQVLVLVLKVEVIISKISQAKSANSYWSHHFS